MLANIDAQNTEAIKNQLADLKSIVAELIDVAPDGSAIPRPGVTKKQMIYAIEQIREIQSIYDERIAEHKKLIKEISEGQELMMEVRSQARYINDKYGGEVYPEWYLKVLGA
jgi:hypothetical protein